MKEITKQMTKLMAIGLCAAVVTAAAVLPQLGADETADVPVASAGMQMESSENRGVSIAAAELPLVTMSAEEREEHGIMPIAETAYTLTATVNDDATVKAVDWTVVFSDPASEWATGKTVTEYVTVSSTGPLTATVQCLQAFGVQILVSAVSRDDPQVKATCTCDYQSQIEGADINFWTTVGSLHISNEGKTGPGETWCALPFKYEDDEKVRPFSGMFICTAVYGVGTVRPGPVSVDAELTIKVSQDALQKLGEKGYAAEPASPVVFTHSLKGGTFSLGDAELTSLFGPDAKGEDLYMALKAVQAENFHNILEATVVFSLSGDTLATVVGYFNVDANSIYTPVISVELSQESILF